jgi:iron complex outermembrane receptor protein
LGIPSLKQETSKSASVGFTYKIPSAKLTLTADGYFIRIDNRILLTGQFARSAVSPAAQLIYDAARVNAVQLFTNAIDTETRGLDIVLTHNAKFSNIKLDNNFAINLNQTRKVGAIHSSGLLQSSNLENVYFSEASECIWKKQFPE